MAMLLPTITLMMSQESVIPAMRASTTTPRPVIAPSKAFIVKLASKGFIAAILTPETIEMSERIKIYTESTGYVSAEASLKRNLRTARAILDALPIRGRVDRWGGEVYFKIPVIVDEENAQEEVEVGDLAYWPAGNGFCIFFGRTPTSTGAKPRAASPVNVFGRVLGNATVFRKTKSGEEIRIEKLA